jgi:hypothetical protein
LFRHGAGAARDCLYVRVMSDPVAADSYACDASYVIDPVCHHGICSVAGMYTVSP